MGKRSKPKSPQSSHVNTMEYLELSSELSVLWDIRGVLWEENILLRDIMQGENWEIVCKKIKNK